MEKCRKIVLLAIIMIMTSAYSAYAGEVTGGAKGDKFDWSEVIDAIVEVESGGNNKAVRGCSAGPMQITPILVKECNNILRRKKSKKRFKLSDRFSLAKSKEMFLLIQEHFNPQNNVEKAIRAWNGGIHYSVKRTQGYFNKVMKAMN